MSQILQQCQTLFDALCAVSNLGFDSGSIELDTDKVHGWVVFEKKNIVRAVIAETGQSGREALGILSALQGAVCRYLPTEEPDKSTVPAQDDDGGAAEATQVIGEQAIFFDPASGKEVSQSSLPIWKRPTQISDEEFRAGIFEGGFETPQEQFEKTNPYLSDMDAPLRKNVVYRRGDVVGDEADPIPLMLAKAGFTSDYYAGDNFPNKDRKAPSYGDPANVKLPSVERPERINKYEKFVAPAILVAVCTAIYVVPAIMWDSASQAASRSAAVDYLVADALKEDTEKKLATSELPKADPPPDHAPSAQTTGSQAAGGPLGGSPVEGDEASQEATEFQLANNAATLDQLEARVKDYIAKRNYKRARALAAAGLRSAYANGEQKERFWALFQQCIGK